MLWGAFNNASSAMQTFTTDLGSISQNVANVNTTGYKRTETMFSTLMSEQHAAPSSSGAPLSIFGVQGTQRNHIEAQGVITTSNTWSDLAINGKGFFMVAPPAYGTTSVPTTISTTNPQSVLYTRDGAWSRAYGPDTDPTLARSYFTTGGGNYLLGWMADDTGAVPKDAPLEPVYTLAPRPIPNNGTAAVSSTSTLKPTSVTMPGRATTTATVLANIPRDGTSVQKIPMTVYDNAFQGRTINLNMTKTGTNTWQLDVANDGNSGDALSPVTPITLSFNGDGQLVSPADGHVNLSLSWTDATTSATSTAAVDVDMSKLSQYDGSSLYIGNVDQDGYSRGTLLSTTFTETGELSGYYDNGQSRVLFKVPVANFVADDALDPVSGNLFRRTPGAGDLTISSVDQAQGEGRFATSSLETSTVDIGEEFTRMIMTQKAYSTNAQVFKTADEMTMTVRDLKT